MPFVKKAQLFLEDQGTLTDTKNVGLMVATVRFLLNNAVGLENAKSTNAIINHLKEQGFLVQRSQWEISILGVLRDHGIFIGSHRNKGMYIINSELEARKVYSSYKKRILKEMQRMELLKKIMKSEGWKT